MTATCLLSFWHWDWTSEVICLPPELRRIFKTLRSGFVATLTTLAAGPTTRAGFATFFGGPTSRAGFRYIF